MKRETKYGEDSGPRNVLMGLVMLGMGLLACSYTYSAWPEGLASAVGVTGMALGPILVLVGFYVLAQGIWGLRRAPGKSPEDVRERDA